MAYTYSDRKYGARTKEAHVDKKVYRPENRNNGEVLTGFVQSKKASDLEERTAKSLKAMNVDFIFQNDIPTEFSLPGQAKTLDFLLLTTPPQPLEIDGNIGHSTAAQRAEDAFKDILLNDVFQKIGWRPVLRLKQWQTSTQENADYHIARLVRK